MLMIYMYIYIYIRSSASLFHRWFVGFIKEMFDESQTRIELLVGAYTPIGFGSSLNRTYM